jgi:hypothetical protein
MKKKYYVEVVQLDAQQQIKFYRFSIIRLEWPFQTEVLR